jgi:hypothetical protein
VKHDGIGEDVYLGISSDINERKFHDNVRIHISTTPYSCAEVNMYKEGKEIN